jgi:type I restriction enzyme S subunit
VATSNTNKLLKTELGNILTGFTGEAFSSKFFSDIQKEGSIPLLRIRDLETQKPVIFYNGKYSEKYLVKAGDLLVGMDGEFNPTIWNGEEALLNQRVLKLQPKGNNNHRYIYYLLHATLEKIERRTPKTTVKHLSLPQLLKEEVMIPGIPLQNKIADILQALDNSIVMSKKTIAQSRHIKKTLALELLTKGIGHTNFNETELGPMPDSWRILKLSDVGENIIGLTYKPQDVVATDGIRVLRSSNVVNGKIDYKDSVFVNTKIPKKLEVQAGDILLCTRNGSRKLIGKAAYIDTDHLGNTFGAFMSVFRAPNSRFIFHFIQSDLFIKQVRRHLGATINQITTGSLNAFQIAYPPLPEQQKINEILDALDNKIQANEKVKAKQLVLRKALMHDLLTGKVQV